MVSEKESPSSPASPRPGSREDIVDAFVVTGTEQMTDKESFAAGQDDPLKGDTAKSATSPKASFHPDPKKGIAENGSGGKISLGWKVALALALFIAGLFTAPYAWPLLQTLGLVENGPHRSSPDPKTLMLPINALQDNAAETLDRDIQNLRQMLASQSGRIQALEAFSQSFPSAESRLKPDTENIRRKDENNTSQEALENGGLSIVEQKEREAENKRLSDRLDRFGQDLQSLTRTLANLQSTTRLTAAERSETGVSRADMIDLRTAIDLVQSEVGALKNRLEATNSQMKSLESGSLAATPRGRVFLALGDFDRKIASSQPFGGLITVLRPDLKALSVIDQQAIGPHIETLERLAGGVKSDRLLRDMFTAMIPELTRRMEQKQIGFLGSLVTIRRTDDKAEGFDRAVKQAEEAVRLNDFSAAQKAIAPYLSLEETPAANNWVTHAKNHNAAKNALEALRRALLSETPP